MAGSRLHMAAVLMASVACAVAPSPAWGADHDVYQFDLPAQDLGNSLRAIVAKAGWELYAAADDINGVAAPSLHGGFTPRQAIERLLRGTNLSVRFDRGAAIVRRRTEMSAIGGESQADTEIVVTGSRIRGAPQISPVRTVTREEIIEAGQTNLGEVIRDLPQNFSGGQNPSIAGGGQGGFTNVSGSSAINLRGLGPDATLTLINGHRVAFDAISQGIDISAIPVAAVDRIDVMTDGASALYGSDAVAGVANVILRRDFDGAMTSARFGAATDGGDVTQQYDLVAGRRWKGGGVMLAGDYLKSTEISAGERSYTSNIYPTYTLIPGQKQISAIAAGHQQISDAISFEFDGNYLHRNSSRCLPTTATADCLAQGNAIKVKVESFSASPSLGLEIADGWTGKLSGTYGKSDTLISTSVYIGGNKAVVALPNYFNELKVIEIGAEGPLFQAPGGDVRLALGAGYRSNTLDVDSRRILGGVESPINIFSQRQNVGFGYAELSVPIVSPINHSALFRKLQFVGAVRYESYRHIESVTTPKIGLIYSPDRDLEFKASWGKSFKAPTLYQIGQTSNAQLISSSAFIPAPPNTSPVLYLYGGNPSLSPERATTWTVSGTIKPQFVRGLQFEVSYFDISYRGRVSNPLLSTGLAFQPVYNDFVELNPTGDEILAAIDGVSGNFTNLTAGAFDPDSVSAIVNDRLQNISKLHAHGVDISARYLHDFGDGERLTVKGMASYFASDRQVTETLPSIETAGTVFNPPHWRARMSASWQKQNVTITAVGNYIGGTTDDRIAPVVHVAAFPELDAVATIRSTAARGLLANLKWAVAIRNIFNQRPSSVRSTNPLGLRYDSVNYPTIGRSVSFTLSKAW